MYDEKDKEMLITLQKKGSRNLKIAIVAALLATVMFFSISVYLFSKPEQNAIDMFYATSKEQSVSLKVTLITDGFAVFKDEDGNVLYDYYFASDGKRTYVVSLLHDQFKTLKDINDYTYDESKKVPMPITIYGVTEIIPNDLKELAIAGYNKIYDQDKITQQNFEQYFGNFYINTVQQVTNPGSFWLGCGTAMLIIFMTNLCVFIVNTKKSKKNVMQFTQNGQLAMLLQQVNGALKEQNETVHIVFLEDYIISYSSGLDMLRYKDIVWIYEFVHKIYGIAVSRSIKILTKDRVLHTIGKTYRGNKKDIAFYAVFNELTTRREAAYVGFSPENKEAFSNGNMDKTIREIEQKDEEH